jgi:hypothetical protein
MARDNKRKGIEPKSVSAIIRDALNSHLVGKIQGVIIITS